MWFTGRNGQQYSNVAAPVHHELLKCAGTAGQAYGRPHGVLGIQMAALPVSQQQAMLCMLRVEHWLLYTKRMQEGEPAAEGVKLQ